MQMRPIDEYLAEHMVRNMAGAEHLKARRELLALWEEHYGKAVADKVRARLRAAWEKKP